MKKWFTDMLFGLEAFDNQLSRYGKVVKVQSKREKSNATVIGGREYVENTAEATDNKRAWESKLATEAYVRNPQLNDWDRTWLNKKFETTKEGWNEGLAIVLKNFFATENPEKPGSYFSAADVEKAKRTSNGLEEGFSERNVKKYFWAFHRAMESIVAENLNEVQEGA